MEFTQEHRNEIEKLVVEAITKGLETNNLQEEELSTISDFVLNKIDAINNQQELLVFLSELSSKWSIFKNIELGEQGKMQEQKEKQVAEDVSVLAKTGKINDAIDLAKTMTQN